MLEESPDNAAHADAIAQTPHTRTQGANAAHDEINLNPSLRGAIQSLHHILVEQGIHLGNDAPGAALAGVLGFAIDESNHLFRQIKRGHQQRVVARIFSVRG